MCAPSPPPAPDYVGAAHAQGAANVEAARAGAKLSNPNIIGPLGTQTVKYGQPTVDQAGFDRAMDEWRAAGNDEFGNPLGGSMPDISQFTTTGDQDVPTITQTLTPKGQATLDAQQDVQLGLAGLGKQALGTAGGILGQQFKPENVNIQTTLPDVGPLDLGPEGGRYGQAQGFDPSKYGQAQGVDASQYGTARGVNGGLYGTARGIDAGPQSQRNLDLSGVARMPVNAGTTGQQAILSRLNPQLDRRRSALAQELANQGITQGSEAYRNAQTDLGQQENDLITQAALQGINLDTAANAQGFGQAMSAAGLYNDALGQDFTRNFGAAQLGNAAIGQNFGQALAGQQAENTAIGQNFGMGTSAQAQQNAAIAQNAGLGLSGVNADNAAIGQNFGQDVTSAGLYNAARGQQANQNLQGATFGNQAAAQNLAQQLALYNQPLNQITALMSGSQIQMPQFQGYTGQNVQAAPLFNATQAQGNAAQQAYAQQMAGYNSMMQGIGGLFGKALPFIFG